MCLDWWRGSRPNPPQSAGSLLWARDQAVTARELSRSETLQMWHEAKVLCGGAAWKTAGWICWWASAAEVSGAVSRWGGPTATSLGFKTAASCTHPCRVNAFNPQLLTWLLPLCKTSLGYLDVTGEFSVLLDKLGSKWDIPTENPVFST